MSIMEVDYLIIDMIKPRDRGREQGEAESQKQGLIPLVLCFNWSKLAGTVDSHLSLLMCQWLHNSRLHHFL